jgi:hypothetical protein
MPFTHQRHAIANACSDNSNNQFRDRHRVSGFRVQLAYTRHGEASSQANARGNLLSNLISEA